MGTGKPSAPVACRVHGAALLPEVSCTSRSSDASSSMSYQRGNFDRVETQRGRAIPRLRRDSVGAPGDVGEQTRMRSLQAEGIIAAVVAGPR